MSDLSRLKLSPEGPAASDSEKNRLFQELLQDPSVLRLLKTHAIPEQLLWDNLYTFSRWQKEVEPCRGCKSLSQCRQKKKGYHMGLSYEGLLVETLEACKYEREKESALSHLKQYLVSDLGSEFEKCFFDRIAVFVQDRNLCP